MLEHSHPASECGVVFSAFKAFASPLRHTATVASCHYGGHRIWWEVEAPTREEALNQLPPYVAERTAAIPVRAVEVP